MCEICQGASDDEVLFGIYGRIYRFGWTIEYVQGRDASHSWGYTIGLTEGFGHPELALAGADAQTTGTFLNSIGRAIRRGDRPVPGHLFRDDGHEHLLLEVHPAHYERGTFGIWDFYYHRLGRAPMEHRVLEVVPEGRSGVFVAEPAPEDP
jgi:hypothetical protein